MHKLTRAQYGYTLIELLLYVSALGVLLTAASSFFVGISDARFKAQSMDEVNQQGLAAMEYITQAVRNATSITTPAAIIAPATGASSTQLIIASDTSSLNPTVINVSNNVLQATEGTGSTVALTNSKVHVTNLTFTNMTREGTHDTIQISLTISRANNSGRNSYSFEKTFITSATVRY